MKTLNSISLVVLCGLLGSCAHTPKEDVVQSEIYSLSKGTAVKIPAKSADLPLNIHGENPGTKGTFVPSGYMGDSGSIKLLSTQFSAPLESGESGSSSLQVVYTGSGSAGWAGIYWLTPANNWGKIKGAGYDLSGSPRLSFWAKGEHGGERLAEVKVGGIVGPYSDTDSAHLQGLRLTKDWKKYVIDLSGKDLRHIVGGFVFTLRRSDNPRGATFYLDEIRFEAPEKTGETDQP